jgi:thioredoxin-like negative regulator of GroEL
MPSYKDKVTFVNAITADPTGEKLAAQFSFQYIPTSFFIDVSGNVLDHYTGPLTESEMRARIDKLVAP